MLTYSIACMLWLHVFVTAWGSSGKKRKRVFPQLSVCERLFPVAPEGQQKQMDLTEATCLTSVRDL